MIARSKKMKKKRMKSIPLRKMIKTKIIPVSFLKTKKKIKIREAKRTLILRVIPK